MAQVESHEIAAKPSTQTAGVDDEADKAAFEHIAHLPKMSATAGVATGEYVAISATAVVAIIIGVASVFTLLNIVLLVVPLAGVIVAIIALRSIANSNGTQTGQSFATIGLVLSLGFSAFAIAQWSIALYDRHVASTSIDQVLVAFGSDMSGRNYNAAYDLMSERFKGRVSQATFTERLKSVQDDLASMAANGVGFGPVTGAQASSLVMVSNSDPTNVTAVTYIKFRYAGGVDEEGQNVILRKSLDRWVIDDMPKLFPTLKSPAGSPQG